MSKYKELKERAWLCNMELPKRGLVIYTFGNVSAADRSAGVFAIKPSGVPYEELKADDMVVVDFENKIVEGNFRYSSDTKTHTVLYNNFSDINGVVHTHSTYSVAWAQAALPIPVFGTTHADHCAGDIPCTDFMTDDAIKGDYEIETGNQIVQTFKSISYSETEMVLVAGHGPFTWGTTPEKAVYNSAVLEELAKMAFITRSINSNTPRLKEALVDKHYQRKHGKNAYYGQASK
ncbi:MAG TPA: L-ribulose-5-phosphate 4-epimerase [Spirochaetota bacterium]|nr:L-ribulose-5-phosphate 4-epimerase [Spirochaetota bacterium]